MHRNPATSSGLKAASGAIMALPGTLMGLVVLSDGTNDATVTLYDSPSAASGNILAKVVVAGAEESRELVVSEAGIVANNGIYAELAGTGCNCIVYFCPG